MEPHDYTIFCSAPSDSEAQENGQIKKDVTIYNLKLTEDLVEKITKGQKYLDDLTGIEFIMSNSEKGIDVRK